jgi:RNA-directed DNA polymerase
MNTAIAPMYQWHTIGWRKIERQVFKLQKRIYRAAERKDYRQVRRLQKLLLRSRAAKLLAVRKVTQDNQGKKTPGVDGVANLTPSERLALVEHLRLEDAASPVRRVSIPKPGTTEQRPLGIPTLADRAKQNERDPSPRTGMGSPV